MVSEKLRRVCSGNLAIYFVGLALLTVGFAYPGWVSGGTARYGLWETCGRISGSDPWTCQRFNLNSLQSWFRAVQAFMSMSVAVAVVAGATYMFIPVSSALQITSAGFSLIGLAIFGGRDPNSASAYGWPFWLCMAGGVLLLANGITLAVLIGKERCSMEKVMPPKPNKIDDNKPV